MSIAYALINAVVDIELQPLPIDTFFSDEQFENVLSLSFVTLFGISMLVSLLHSLNASLLIVVRLSGNVTVSRFLQLWNAKRSIEIKPSPKFAVFKTSLPLKALKPMVLTSDKTISFNASLLLNA